MNKEDKASEAYSHLCRGNPSPEQYEKAYESGMLRKEQLEDGQYYYGHCRNASVALWSAPLNQFLHQRYKFGSYFVEPICYPTDNTKHDVFVPIEKDTPSALEVVAQTEVQWYIDRKNESRN